MTVQHMRFVDYWIGIPLCFLFSVVSRFAEIKGRKRREKKMPRKVLFVLLSEMGSAILAYPAIKQFKERYPTATAYFFSFQKNEEGIHLLGIIPQEQIISIRDTCLWHLFYDVLKGIVRIRREKIDTVIDMELFSRGSSIISFLSGALIRIGFHKYTMEGLYRGSLHTHRVAYNPYIHISQNFIALVDALEVNPVDVPLLKKPVRQHDGNLPLISIPAEERDALRAYLHLLCPSYIPTKQIVVMHIEMNDNLSVRKWPFDSYMMLAERLLTHDNVCILFVGMQPLAGEQRLIDHERCINLLGRTSVLDVLRFCTVAQVLVSHDCGLNHIAALTAIHIVALFGPETPQLYAPLTKYKTVFYEKLFCSPCLSSYNFKRSICRNNICMKTISVEAVYDAVCSSLMLNKPREHSTVNMV